MLPIRGMKTPDRKPAAKQTWPYIRFSERDQKWMVDARTKDGGSRRFFAKKIEADSFASQCRITRGNEGTGAFGNADLAQFGKSVQDAIAFYLAHLRRMEKSVSVTEAITALIDARKRGWSARHAKGMEYYLGRFAVVFGKRQIGGITGEEIKAWLDGLNLSDGNRNSIIQRISPLFSFSRGKKWCAENPFTGGKDAEVPKGKDPRKRVRVLSVEQTARLLESASDETLPFWAIACFAGLRPESEIKRLDWRQIDLEEKVIEVDSDADEDETKTGRRTVKMHDNLVQWLRPYVKKSGRIIATASISPLWKKLRADKRKAGFGTPGSETPQERKAGVKLQQWTPDITRHTYISNLITECGDIGVVATQAGNSPQIIRKHYLSLVKPASASAFWNIAPPATEGGEKIIAMA